MQKFVVSAVATDDVEIMRLALAKFLKVDDMPPLGEQDLQRLHDEYMQEMTGTTPLPHEHFKPMFALWQKFARASRYLGFRNVQEHHINIRYQDAMPLISLHAMDIKKELIPISYAIPTLPALLAMVDTHSKMVEVGAGSGYLALQLADLGADIVCCDVDVQKHPKSFYTVKEMDGRDFIRSHDGFPDRALLICWGYYKDGIPEQYEEMIKLFRGDFLYIIGEHRYDQRTFCLAKCGRDVQDQWVQIGVYDLPAFEDYRLYNQLAIYKRKEAVAFDDTNTVALQMRSPTLRGLEYL